MRLETTSVRYEMIAELEPCEDALRFLGDRVNWLVPSMTITANAAASDLASTEGNEYRAGHLTYIFGDDRRQKAAIASLTPRLLADLAVLVLGDLIAIAVNS